MWPLFMDGIGWFYNIIRFLRSFTIVGNVYTILISYFSFIT